MSETLTHGMNCAGLNPMSEDDCTCGLKWRIQLQTEQEMHNAWRKRAEKAESLLETRTPGEDAWADEIEHAVVGGKLMIERDKLKTILRAYRANLRQQNRAEESLCGTAGDADTLMNEATHLTATDAYLFEGHLLPEAEWKNLSPDSQHKLQTWFRLATERLQLILDEPQQQSGEVRP